MYLEKMCKLKILVLISIATTAMAIGEETSVATSTSGPPPPPQPMYKPPQQTSPYVPHQTYPYSDGFGLYDGFFYPQMLPGQPQPYAEQQTQQNYPPAVLPASQGAFQFALKVMAKFGLFVLGGVALLLIGGIFTTIICNLTSICVVSFNTLGGLNKDAMKSLMTPEKISAAAALVQDAIGKYQRLQRATRT